MPNSSVPSWLVFGGCGSALLAAGFPDLGIGFVGVSLAFGLTVVTMAYGIGHISGAHLNPAVTIGLLVGGRVETKDVLPYIIAQILGGIVAAGALYVIVTGNGSEIGTFAANGYGDHSPGGYSMTAALLTEVIMTFIFLIVIIGATDERAPAGLAGLGDRTVSDVDPPCEYPCHKYLLSILHVVSRRHCLSAIGPLLSSGCLL